MAHSKGNHCSEHRVVAAVFIPGHGTMVGLDMSGPPKSHGFGSSQLPKTEEKKVPHPRAMIQPGFKVAPNTSHLHVFRRF